MMRTVRNSQSRRKRITPEQIEKMRKLLSNPDSPMTREQVARRFGLAPQTLTKFLARTSAVKP